MRTNFLFALACLCLLWAGPAGAQVEQAVLSPDGSELTQTLSARLQPAGPGTWEAIVDLPAAASPDSLRILDIKAPKARIESVGHTTVRTKDAQQVASLRAEIERQKKVRDQLNATLAGISARIELWQNAVRSVSRAGDGLRPDSLQALSANLGQALPTLVQDKLAKENELRVVRTRIQELEKELQSITGSPQTHLQVTVRFSAPDLQGRGDIPLTVSYVFPHSRWRPAYTLEADPEGGSVHFQWTAVVRQRTGLPWENTHILLSTGRMRQQVSPPPLPDWIIRPRPSPKPLLTRDSMARTKALGQAAPKMREAARITRQTYDVWDLGRRTIQPGREQRLAVSTSDWPAKFQRIVRPGVDSRAYLQSKITPKTAQNIPPGPAMLLVQGRMVGKRTFSFSGRKTTRLSFGPDPQVTCQRVLERRQAGEEGLLKNVQKLTWIYRYDLENGKDRPVQVRLEESRPVSRHEDIRIELKSPDSSLQIEDDTLVWDLRLPPGGRISVPLQVKVTAPEDMDLSTSR